MEPLDFSHETRARDLAAMAAEPVDLLVVGGGITGAGTARDAALRGLRVALVERRDFASGTSSRSSKLIHGGVRYLQQGDLPLVLEAAEERRTLRRIAPHLTQPRPMMFPTYGRGTHAKLNLGLWTYEKLAAIAPAERHEMLDCDEACAREPGLRREGLTGAAVYPENLTDDARLVIATLRSARREGALVANHAEVAGIDARPGQTLVRVLDRSAGCALDVQARVVVNAGGPWSDDVRVLADRSARRTLHLTKGIHFAVGREDLPVRHMIVMQARDRRPVFAVPRGAVTYVGTTDTDFGGPTDYPEVTVEDVAYLVDAVRSVFPGVTWGVERVVTAWAGLRPLVHEEGKKPAEISRKDEVVEHPAGMITVAGGKLTTYRRMAQKVVDLVERRLGGAPTAGRPGTGDVPLDGGDVPPGWTPENEAARLSERYGALLAGRPSALERLILFYGSDAERLLEQARSSGCGFLGDTDALAIEVDRGVREEMALHLTDVLERRLRLLLFDPQRGLDVAAAVAERMAGLLGWTEAAVASEVEQYRAVAESCRPRGGRA